MNTLVAIALGSILAAPIPKDPPKPESLDGEWNLVEIVRDGQRRVEKGTVTIKGDQFTIHDAKRMRDEVATITLDPKASPMTIDIKPEGEKNLVIKGIYKIEKDKLTICFGKEGTDRPNEFKSEAGSGIGLIVLERAKK